MLKLRCNTSQLWVPLASANQDKPLNYHVKTTPNNSKKRKSTSFRKKKSETAAPLPPHLECQQLAQAPQALGKATRRSWTIVASAACPGRLAPFNTARGFSGKDAERSNRSLCPIKRRDARVASPHNTQRAAWSHPVPGNTHICPRRRVVPCREERRVFRLSLAALPSELGKGEEHTQSVLSQEDDGLKMLAPP